MATIDSGLLPKLLDDCGGALRAWGAVNGLADAMGGPGEEAVGYLQRVGFTLFDAIGRLSDNLLELGPDVVDAVYDQTATFFVAGLPVSPGVSDHGHDLANEAVNGAFDHPSVRSLPTAPTGFHEVVFWTAALLAVADYESKLEVTGLGLLRDRLLIQWSIACASS